MKFAHIADCHIGAWRDPKMRDANLNAFVRAVRISIERNVDFILLAGDLFNTSMPGFDGLKQAVKELKALKEKKIPVYAIAGSHDYSPSGKTMIDVLDEAGLLINVVKGEVVDNRLKLKFTTDAKTGAKIAGMFGRKGMLDRKYYEDLVRENLENESGFKIFMFHTAISEFKPKELEKMDAAPLSLLPKGFDYYAGGHVHYVREFNEGNHSNVVFPGPTFPNSFRELEMLKCGGFYIYDNGKLEPVSVPVFNVFSLEIDCDGKDPANVTKEIMEKIKHQEFIDTIVTLRLKGKLLKGKPNDFDFKQIFKEFYYKGAYFVMKSAYNLQSAEFEEVKIDTASVEDAEERIIKEHLGQVKVGGWSIEKERATIRLLMSLLEMDKHEGEKVMDFEKRVIKEVSESFNMEL